MTTNDKLRGLVFEALDNAVDNGYGDVAHDLEANRTAIDLGTYSSELEGLETAVPVPHIQEWRKQHPKR